MRSNLMETAVFAGGCFWCMEAVFKSKNGIVSIEPGYTGGKDPNPTYEKVCTGMTEHAEAIQIKFDPTQTTYQELLALFFEVHDPTALDRQGGDIGTQYRSAVYYTSPEQKEILSQVVLTLSKSGKYSQEIQTQQKPLTVFYPAESYHHDYFRKNPLQAYCQMVIKPKVDKFAKK